MKQGNHIYALKARIEQLEQQLDLDAQAYEELRRENDQLRDQVRRLQARAFPQRRVSLNRVAS
jgi:cell division protein FtsB